MPGTNLNHRDAPTPQFLPPNPDLPAPRKSDSKYYAQYNIEDITRSSPSQSASDWVPEHAISGGVRRSNIRSDYADSSPRQGSLQQQQQPIRSYASTLSPQYLSSHPLNGSESPTPKNVKSFSAVIKPPPMSQDVSGRSNANAQHVLGKNEQQRQQLQYLNTPLYQPIQKMLASSGSIFSDSSVISRIVRSDEVLQFSFLFILVLMLFVLNYLFLSFSIEGSSRLFLRRPNFTQV
jgi:hypothetical protein